MGKLLDQIVKENDIKNIAREDYRELAKEIRIKLVQSISHTGGHLASNLGVVELTMALHLVFDPSKDKIVWDVGHQSYTHKILTGRRAGFDELRKYGGMSGFPKRKESRCDPFDTGTQLHFHFRRHGTCHGQRQERRRLFCYFRNRRRSPNRRDGT